MFQITGHTSIEVSAVFNHVHPLPGIHRSNPADTSMDVCPVIWRIYPNCVSYPIHQMGSGIHKLTGDMADFWSITVTPNYRIIFRFEGGDIHDVDYVDYH